MTPLLSVPAASARHNFAATSAATSEESGVGAHAPNFSKASMLMLQKTSCLLLLLLLLVLLLLVAAAVCLLLAVTWSSSG
jgi:hypothetical protein